MVKDAEKTARGGGDPYELLTERQQRFVDAYLENPNATQAALQAGYSARSATELGRQTLLNLGVKAAIARHRADRCERTNITTDFVLRELAILAQANILDYVDVDDKGEWSINLSKVARAQTAAIAELTVDELVTGRRVRFKLVDKLRTLELLGKHTDIRAFVERHSVEDGDDLAAELEEMDRRAREGRKGNGNARGDGDEAELEEAES